MESVIDNLVKTIGRQRTTNQQLKLKITIQKETIKCLKNTLCKEIKLTTKQNGEIAQLKREKENEIHTK